MQVIDFSNKQSLEFDYGFLIIGLIGFLLIELLILLLFFIFKGISVYVDDIDRKEDLKSISKELFILSFIIAFGWFIASVMTIFVKWGIHIPGAVTWYGVLAYVLIAFMTIAIIGAIFLPEIKNLEIIKKLVIKDIKILKFFNIITNFFIKNLKFLPLILFLLILLFDIFSILVPQILLTGTYSIEQSLTDNPDMLTFSIKEKGIRYNINEVTLFKLNSSYPIFSKESREDNINHIIANISSTNATLNSPSSCYLWVVKSNKVWYLNIINISNLSSGTYLLRAEIKNDRNDTTIGISKRITEKLFYIPPKSAKANDSIKCTQPS